MTEWVITHWNYNSYHDSIAWEESKDIAQYVLDTGVINEYIIMYHNTSVDPYWTDAYDVSGMVGSHIFYRKKDQWILNTT